MELKIVNRIIATIIILTNIYFISLGYIIIKESGGPMGYGLLLVPILLSTNVFLITAGLTFRNKFKESITLLVINGFGLVWNLFWFWLFFFDSA